MKSMNGDELKAGQTVTKSIVLVLLVTATILLIPLVAMQFTNEVLWTVHDFIAAGILLLGAGFLYVALGRMVRNARYRIAGGIALALAFLLVWVELAVGIFD